MSEGNIWISKIEELKQAKELTFEPTHGFGKYKDIFVEEAKTHPAKMNLNLLEYLILNYTKEGDVILEPMAGTFSTCVLASLNNRHSIGVELELKFVEMFTGIDCDGYTCHVFNCYKRKDIEKEMAELKDKLKDVNKEEIKTKIVWQEEPRSNFNSKVDEEKTPSKVVKIFNDIERLEKLEKEYQLLPRKPHRFIGTLEKLKQRLTLLPIGKIKVIQGDSRKLSELLSNSQTDIIITSPPYVNATLKKEFKSEEELDKFVKGQKWLLEHGRSEEGIKRFIKKSWTGYPDSPDNIGNLPIGDVDTIITSPPYGERRNYQDIERSKANIDKYFSKKNINPDLYAEDPANINRLEYKEDIDAIITSPPYAESLYHLRNKPKEFWEELSKRTGRKAWLDPNSKTRKTQSEKDEGYGKDKENIGNLPLGNVDAIITSPPYGESMTKKRKGYTIFPQLAKTREMPQDTKDENIANLPHGDIDAIITSPPYEGSILSGGDPARRKERLLKAGHNPEDFLGGKARNAVLKHYDEVDAIITSPPYAESLSVTSGGRKGRWDKDGTTKKKKLPTTYSDNSNNIGNMPLGNVDAIITSPPYAESMQERGGTQHKFEKEKKIGVHYSHDKTNIGNLPLGKIDVAITSPPYEGSMEGGSRHTGGIIERTKDSNSDTTVKGGLGVKYSENSNNIGNMKKETYLEAMLKVYSECYKVLKDGGLMIVVVKAFYRNKKVVDLPYQTLLLLQKAGFQFEDVLKLKLDRLSFWRILQFKKNPNIPRVVHEHIIIVRKGDVN